MITRLSLIILTFLLLGCQPTDVSEDHIEIPVDKVGQDTLIEITAESCQLMQSPQEIEACLVRAAYESGDISLCEEMTDQFFKDRCLLGVATSLNDSSICDRIVGTDDKKRCKE